MATAISPAIDAWTEWTDWSECSASCGRGTRTRKRTCTAAPCPGSAEDVSECTTPSCEDATGSRHSLRITFRNGTTVPHRLVVDLAMESRLIWFCSHHDAGGEHVKWIRDDGVGSESRLESHRTAKPIPSRRLRIMDLKREDGGVYRCVYSGPDGTSEERAVRLTVEDSLAEALVEDSTTDEGVGRGNVPTTPSTEQSVGSSTPLTPLPVRAEVITMISPSRTTPSTRGVLTRVPSTTVETGEVRTTEMKMLTETALPEKENTTAAATLPEKENTTEISSADGENLETSVTATSPTSKDSPTTISPTAKDVLKEIIATSTSSFPGGLVHVSPSGESPDLRDDIALSGVTADWAIPVGVTLSSALLVIIFIIVLRFYARGQKPVQSSEENPYKPEPDFESPLSSPERKRVAYRMRLRLEAPTPPLSTTSPAGPDGGVVVYGSLGVRHSASLNADNKAVRLSYVDTFGHTREESPPDDERASPEGHEQDEEGKEAVVDLESQNLAVNQGKDDYADLDVSAFQVGLPRPPPVETSDYAEIEFTSR